MYNNPLIYIDPDGHAPTVMEAAHMAQHIYGATKADVKDEKIVINRLVIIDIITNGNKGGLKIGVYSKTKVDGSIEYALVNKGSDLNWSDWINNAQQPFGYSQDMKDSISKSLGLGLSDKVPDHSTTVGIEERDLKIQISFRIFLMKLFFKLFRIE